MRKTSLLVLILIILCAFKVEEGRKYTRQEAIDECKAETIEVLQYITLTEGYQKHKFRGKEDDALWNIGYSMGQLCFLQKTKNYLNLKD